MFEQVRTSKISSKVGCHNI